MSLAQQVAPHIPLLRRFSRALTGSQQSGDAYVMALLEALIADPNALRTDMSLRVALYHLLCTLWGSLRINLQGSSPAEGWERRAVQRLDQITPRARQAFLLVAVEGFSLDEAALILDIGVDQLNSLLDQVSREIADQMATDVLIIEDEPIIAMDIESLVSGLGHNVTAIARTHGQAVEAAKRQQPGLVLADIQLADGSSGLEAVNELLTTFEAPVIFITAFPERFLTGERPEPAFLIAKPFQPATVSAVASQALFFGRTARRRARAPV
jgi:DNA-directed RNA polymerase specialized sigma24 family protein